MRNFKNKRLVTYLLLLFFIASFGTTFAFWASSVQGSTQTGDGTLEIGTWVPGGFFGVTEDGAGDMITLDEIGTPGYPLSEKYIQMSDINLNNQPFNPIGLSLGTAFTGEFHGNGFDISNLEINITDSNNGVPATYIGLFHQNEGIISRVSLVDPRVTVSKSSTQAGNYQFYVGAITGINTGIINQVRVVNSIISATQTSTLNGDTELHVGGVVGRNAGDIFETYSTGSITGTSNKSTLGNNQILNPYSFVGGIAGTNIDLIQNSYAEATISSIANSSVTDNGGFAYAHSYAGGLVGRNEAAGVVTRTYATGSVVAQANASNTTKNKPDQADAKSYAGGLVGHNDLGTVSNSFATGSVQARTQTSPTGAATRYFGYINGLGVSVGSYRLETQVRSGVAVSGATGTNVANATEDGIGANQVILATQTQLRTTSFIPSWTTIEWSFDSTYYPRLKRNKY